MITTGSTNETTQIANAATAIDNATAETRIAASMTLADNGTTGRRGGTRNDPSGNMSIVGGIRFMAYDVAPPDHRFKTPPFGRRSSRRDKPSRIRPHPT